MSDRKTKFIEKLSNISEKVGNNSYLQGISQGVMGALPFIIIGAFASLFMGLPIEGWQSFMASTGFAPVLNMLVNATTNFLGIIVTYFVARSFAEKLGVTSKVVGFLAIMFFLVLLPSYTMDDGHGHVTSYLSYDFLGTKGMLIGILIAIVTVRVFKLIIDKKIIIKMPEGTPPFVSNSFAALVPGFVIAIIALVVRIIFSLTPFNDAFDFVYTILQSPLQQIVGNNVWSLIIISCLVNLLFAFGIHPGFLLGMIAPILFALDGANQAAFASGKDVPNIIGMAFSYITTTAVFYPAIAISVLLFTKSKQLKTVGKIAIAPSFFGISEPLVFGIPVVFNPIVIIPWVLAPVVNLLIGYSVISIGLVAKPIGTTIFNVPMVFTGMMNGSISIVLLEIVLLVIDILLFMPFLKLIDKKYMEAEKSQDQVQML
jgi:cellobiose PTS system EIIC component